MKNRGKINLVLDFIIFLCMLGLFFVKGNFHETLAYTVGTLLIVHIVLHWQQIKALYRQLLPEAKHRVLGGVVIAALILTVLTMPMYLNTGERGHGQYGPPGQFERADQD